MVSATEHDANNLVLIHTLRTNADAMKRIADQQDRISGKIDSTSEIIHDIDKRLAVIEANSLQAKVQSNTDRIDVLEDLEQRRVGAVGLGEFVLKSWPAVVGFLLLLSALIATGRVSL